MSSFDTARDIRLPGIVIERVYIDPAKLTSRMKNSVKSMLRSGVLKGGWSSKSKQLAQKITEGTNVMMFSMNGRGFYAPSRSSYSDAVAKQVCALIDADEALELIDDARVYEGVTHLDGIKQRTRDRHSDAKKAVLGTHYSSWCWMHSKELTEEIAEVFASSRSAKNLEAAEKLCDMLDNNKPIPITLSN